MDNSDEYFDDSFILDGAALASIQAAEERFRASLSQACRSQPVPLLHDSPTPPSKRLKTSHGSIDGIARFPLQPVLKMESFDLNPEIRVGPDGNYVVSTQSKAITQAARSGGQSGSASRPSGRLDGTLSAGGTLASEVATPSSTSHTPVVPVEVRPVAQHFSHLHENQYHPPSQSRPALSQEPPRHQTQTLSRERSLDRRTTTSVHSVDESSSSTASQRRARIIEQTLAEISIQSQIPAPGISRDVAQPDSADIYAELVSLRAQLSASNAENAVIQRSLREALDAQLVKAGEVSILRQTIDKTNKEHAEVIAKAKADMMAHEKLKSELNAKLKEETERIATRLVFHQHELETSTRKPAWGSARSRHIAKNPSISTSAFAATPTRAQAAFSPPSTSHSTRQVSPGHSHQDQQRGGNGPLSSPTSGYRATRSGEDAKQPRFKGFHNAFIDAEPVMAKSKVSDKEGNIGENQRKDPFMTPMKPRDVRSRDSGNGKWNEKGREVDEDSQIDWCEGDAPDEEVVYKEEAMVATDQEEDGDFIMLPGGKLGEEDIIEEFGRIVFTHIAPRNDALTLHILLSTIIPSETPSDEKNAYMAACQVILETCGRGHGRIQYPDGSECGAADVFRKVVNAFVIVGGILARTGCVSPLMALLDLLLLLALYIPASSTPFLGPPAANGAVDQLDLDSPSQLLCMVCDVVREYLAPPKPNLNVAGDTNGKENMRAALAVTVVQLMESLCWTVKDHLVDRLGVLLRQPRVFEILLDPAQAPELIARTLQLLVLLANTLSNDQASLFMRNPSSLVEKLCYYLVEPVAEESYRIRHLVIILISVLANSHIEARTILLDSVTLAPSLVTHIAKLSRLLWEDNLSIMNTPELAKLIVDILYSSVRLLHHLVFVLGLSPVLGRKLIEATRLPGPFNGVTHMFIVTFGRLSWAECPDWLDKECKDRCEIIAEHAMEIIETVVAGPECDSLWAVWHQLEVTDEEEIEAWKIPID